MPDSKLHLFALIIGTGTDAKGNLIPRFKSSINDAEWLAVLLQDPLVCGYPKENVKVLLGEEATRDNILGKLEEITDQVLSLENENENKNENEKKYCTVVFFFSGHGKKEGNKTYLIPYDCSTPYKNNAISGDMLFEKFKAMGSNRVLLLLNACYSGAVMPKLGANDQEAFGAAALFPEAKLNSLLNGKGFACLCASQPLQAALTGYSVKTTSKKYSLFTIGLARGFAGLAKDNYDDLVYIGDLQTACIVYVSGKSGKKQIPKFDFKGDNFAVGYYKPGASSRHPLLGDDIEFESEPEVPETLKPKFTQSTTNNVTTGNTTLQNVVITGSFLNGIGSYSYNN